MKKTLELVEQLSTPNHGTELENWMTGEKQVNVNLVKHWCKTDRQNSSGVKLIYRDSSTGSRGRY